MDREFATNSDMGLYVAANCRDVVEAAALRLLLAEMISANNFDVAAAVLTRIRLTESDSTLKSLLKMLMRSFTSMSYTAHAVKDRLARDVLLMHTFLIKTFFERH